MEMVLFVGFLIGLAWVLFHIHAPTSDVSKSASDLVGCLWAGIVVFVIAVLLLAFGHC